jgi:hypothetical protein
MTEIATILAYVFIGAFVIAMLGTLGDTNDDGDEPTGMCP